MSLTLYLAGPMRGKPDHNYPTFNVAADFLRADGWDVANPAEHFDGDTTLPPAVYLREAARVLSECDGIVFLHGWQESAGARMEYAIAQACAMPMFTLHWVGDPMVPETHNVRLRPMKRTPPMALHPALMLGVDENRG
jgi:hypothetical protein